MLGSLFTRSPGIFQKSLLERGSYLLLRRQHTLRSPKGDEGGSSIVSLIMPTYFCDRYSLIVKRETSSAHPAPHKSVTIDLHKPDLYLSHHPIAILSQKLF
jgi:hypothetical protein